ncbi:LysR family transcriptional regulator [Acetobacter oeni]|uniref:Transcriptional regulator n=1 Tax=Acetobacter oeni TaxID=304077 RepID=A0A511XLG7_9PROT|nr:LysR family transcriptional regulator [Acetobacter oeni]MBB3883591.1 DNA-binding transcriptional LysR family regulator [Acetobacter oeni]NHO19672.1 LysR family transcriptional regulator [Acetobacter oeni]GEN63795.1 transcriptional regulator [Acetobacter oeni]
MDALRLSQLQFFCAIIEEGSIVAAARRMNCVASNITARLKELELLLGQQLFEREKGRLAVTPSGRLFYREARELVAQAHRLSHMFEPDVPRGILAVGALDVAMRSFLPERVPAFLRAHPRMELNLLIRPSYTLERMLADGEIDLALTDGPVVHSLLDSCFAFDEPLRLVVPPHIGALEDIDWASTRVFLFNTDCFYRRRFEAWLRDRGIHDPVVQTVESYDVIRACVHAGLGISCFPHCMLRDDTGGIRVLAPDDLRPGPVYFVWRRDGVSEPLTRFVASMTEGGQRSS